MLQTHILNSINSYVIEKKTLKSIITQVLYIFIVKEIIMIEFEVSTT